MMPDMTDVPRDKNGPEKPKSSRVRLIVHADETLNAAVSMRASKETAVKKRKVSKSEVVASILREVLKDEIAELERYSVSEKQAQGKKPKK